MPAARDARSPAEYWRKNGSGRLSEPIPDPGFEPGIHERLRPHQREPAGEIEEELPDVDREQHHRELAKSAALGAGDDAVEDLTGEERDQRSERAHADADHHHEHDVAQRARRSRS